MCDQTQKCLETFDWVDERSNAYMGCATVGCTIDQSCVEAKYNFCKPNETMNDWLKCMQNEASTCTKALPPPTPVYPIPSPLVPPVYPTPLGPPIQPTPAPSTGNMGIPGSKHNQIMAGPPVSTKTGFMLLFGAVGLIVLLASKR